MSFIPPTGSIITNKHALTENSPLDFSKKFIGEIPSYGWIFNGTEGKNGWFISPVTVTFVFPPQIKEAYYRFNTSEWILYTEPFVIYEQGIIWFDFKLIDVDGHVYIPPTPLEIRIDYTKPVIYKISPEKGRFYFFGIKLFKTGSNTSIIIGKFTVEAVAGDIHSGIHNVTFSLAKEGETPETYVDWDTLHEPYKWELTGRHIGEYTLTVTAYNLAGLSTNITLDITIIQFGIL